MSQVYVRSGRGGAGNFKPKEPPKPIEVEMQPPRLSLDLEAQLSDATSTDIDPNKPAAQTQVPPPQYKTYARGGAGNWYEPEVLKLTGTFTSTTTPGNPTTITTSSTASPTDESASSPKTPQSATSATAFDSLTSRVSRVWQGRGGMGNWEAAEQAVKEEQKRKSVAAEVADAADLADALEAIHKQAELEAESAIKPPESAHVYVHHLDRHQNIGDEVHDI